MGRATLFEEHASVLPHWVGSGLRDATVVCLDAHLDLRYIAPDRIARLQACSTPAEMRKLESPHPLSPCRDFCFGIEDFLHAAAQLGIVRRLVWVAPPHVLLDLDATLRALRQMEGVTAEQLDSMRRVPGGWIEGQLLGLEIAVVEWQQLAALPLEGPIAVDIDTGYFFRMPQDRIWARPRVIVTALQERLGRGLPLTISRSVGSGFCPLRYRFLALHLATLWAGHDDEARHWQRLLELQTQPMPQKERIAGLRALRSLRPGCAATCLALAQAVISGAERELLREKAAVLDPHYANDVQRRIGALWARHHDLDLATVVRLHRDLTAAEDLSERMGAAWVALGLMYAEFGRSAEAIACDARSRRRGDEGHPDLALEIGRLELTTGRTEAALPWLERAAVDDETRVAAWLHLSVCASRRGALEEACNWARAASEAAPAWPEPVSWLQGLGGKPGYDDASSAGSSSG
jgi:tetratricopeptide (TPR) repeat protein